MSLVPPIDIAFHFRAQGFPLSSMTIATSTLAAGGHLTALATASWLATVHSQSNRTLRQAITLASIAYAGLVCLLPLRQIVSHAGWNCSTSPVLIPCYPDLRSIPGGVDGVVIITRPDITERIVHDCSDAGVRRVWMHQSMGKKGSSVSPKAVEYCRQHDISVIAGACPMMFGPGADFGHKHVHAVVPQAHRVGRGGRGIAGSPARPPGAF
jgi:hypothetical protein